MICERRAALEDLRTQALAPAGVALVAEPLQLAGLDDVGGDEQRPRERVDPADVAVEQVGAVDALAAELRVEVEAARS